MAILWCDSFDSYGTTSDMTKSYGSNPSNLGTINLTGGPNSSPCLRFATSGGTLTTTFYASPAATAIGGRFWFKQAAVAASANILAVTSVSGSLSWALGTLVTSGKLYANPALGNNVTTTIGTTNVCDNIFHLIEFQMDAKDAAGVVKVWIDGVLEINLTGVDTHTGTAVNPAWGTQLQLASNNATGIRDIDDLVIFDSAGNAGSLRTADQPYGNLVIATLRPSGAGSSTQFTPSAGSNYQCVDEVAQNGATDYVSSATSGHRDLYAMGNMGVVPTTVYGYVAKVFADNPGGGTISLKQTLKSSATTVTSTTTIANILGDYVVTAYDTDPNGSIAWTQTNVDAVEQGFEVV